MKAAFFDTHDYDREFFDQQNSKFKHEIVYFEPRLTTQTALLAKDFPCICCFVNDRLDTETLCILACKEIRLIGLRSAGYNNVNLIEAEKLGLTVVRVPAYSPHAVAEHAVGLIQALNRKIHRAYGRVRDFNFSISGFVGFDLNGKTVGVIGTGRIGAIFARIMKQGFGCKLLAYDLEPNSTLIQENIVSYVDLPTLYQESDIIITACPFNSIHPSHQPSFMQRQFLPQSPRCPPF